MPRLGGGTFGQSYLINLSDANTNTTNGDNGEPRIESAPLSGPRAAGLSQSQSPGILVNRAHVSPRRTAQGDAMELPTTRSVSDTDAQFTMPLKNSPRGVLRAAESTGAILSPRRRRDAMELPSTVKSISDTDTAPTKLNRQIWRASEPGSQPVLPEFIPSPHSSHRRRRGQPPGQRGVPDRSRTRSVPSLRKIVLRGMKKDSSPTLPTTDTPPSIPKRQSINGNAHSLRRRTASSTASDDEDLFSYRSRDTDSPYRFSRNKPLGRLYSLQSLSRMKVGHILQLAIVLAVTLLVYESNSKAIFAANQLRLIKDEESLLLLHLQKIEQQSIQLHENLSRLAQSGGGMDPDITEKKTEGGDVDFDLIHKQTQQLYQMEEELNHEVRTLQSKIQQSARNHIIQEFGEGPVQVIFDLEFGENGESGQIAILLWHDTPHAAWTWLEQIRRHVWDGAEFIWQQSHIIDAIPRREDRKGGRIEFVEQSQHGHEAWTVGLRESDVGDLQMFFNLQDNANIHKHEVCVGKVIEGFDALQRLLEVSRNKKDDEQGSVQIKKATAMHVTKIEGV